MRPTLVMAPGKTYVTPLILPEERHPAPRLKAFCEANSIKVHATRQLFTPTIPTVPS